MRGTSTGVAAVGFLLAAAAAVAFAVAYSLDAGPELQGVLIAVMFGALAVGLAVWSKRLMPTGLVEQPRHPAGPDAHSPAAALEARHEMIGRRRLLGGLLGGAVAAIGGALLFPLRSLGPRPEAEDLYVTAWAGGARLVDPDGRPVRADQMEVGALLTVFPEGHVGAADAQAVLVRVDPRRDITGAGRDDWAPDGHVAYSRLCTHMGCPVGIYEVDTELLVCPCHQSAFDVLQGARPTFGPATRPLPQLPLAVGPDGVLTATGDFPSAVGPGFWRRP